MTIKTYRGKTIAEALSQVKKDLGRDAVILNTRTYRAGGVLGFGARVVHEITASDQAPSVLKQPSASGASRLNRQEPPRRPLQTVGAPAPLPQAAPLAQATSRAADPGAASASKSPENSLKQMAQMIMASQPRIGIEEELASIKKMVGQVLRTSAARPQPDMPESLFDCYRTLLESEVASEIASEVASAVRAELSTSELADPHVVQRAVLRRVAAYIQVSGDMGRIGRAPDGRPLTIALVGPTGVGKTTTIAKLAATFKLRQGRRVGLITCDTYRIAAVDQLRTYAGIISVPLRVVSSPAEMRSAVAAFAECDAILIDTAGRPPKDQARLDELKELLAAANPHQTHLVLSSAAAEPVLLDAAARFIPLGCDRVIMTKLDEAVNFGVLVNVLRKIDARLSFVTTGQEVPDQIEAAGAERLARLVMRTGGSAGVGGSGGSGGAHP